MNYLANAGGLVIGFVFGAIVTLFVLRFLAEVCRADFHNPLCQVLYRYTNPILQPLRRVLPTWRRWNTAALVLAYLAELIKLLLGFALVGAMPSVPGLLVLGLAELVDYFVMLYVVLVFAWSLMSMMSTDRYHPVIRLVGSLVEPVLRPLRGRIVLGGLDFSPAVVILALMLLRVTLVLMISDIGMRLAGGA